MKRHAENKEHEFEKLEHNNERHRMVDHRSEYTSPSVANNWSAVMDMKGEAMDEAYGMAGKRDVEKDMRKAHAQSREYGWN